MPNITKQTLIQEIAKSTGFVRNDIKTVIEQFLDLVGEKLIEGNTIEIRGFGTFSCKPQVPSGSQSPHRRNRHDRGTHGSLLQVQQ